MTSPSSPTSTESSAQSSALPSTPAAPVEPTAVDIPTDPSELNTTPAETPASGPAFETPTKKVVLVILDGYGINHDEKGNALALSNTPTIDMLNQHYPSVCLQASGIAVGLPWGEVGNSEVGHQTIGSGLVLYQSLPRISLSIEDESFFSMQHFIGACDHAKKNNSALHLMGIVSDGGVHGHIDHLIALIRLASEQGVSKLFVHAFTDGRDVSDQTAEGFLDRVQAAFKEYRVGQFATLGGRFWAMDRADNWERLEVAYKAMVHGEGATAASYKEALEQGYTAGESDENLKPVVIVDKKGKPVGPIQKGDAAIFFNYREDRAHQLAKALTLPAFSKFERGDHLSDFEMVTFTEYAKNLPVRIAFEPQIIDSPLVRSFSEQRLRHLHVAEAEKYAHVTFFFNGGKKDAFEGEKRVIVPSPDVDDFADVPAMSAAEATDAFLKEFFAEDYAFSVLNYANADMLGHTGNLEATVKSVEFMDSELWRLMDPLLGAGAHILITADHGNAEAMINGVTDKSQRCHTTNPVPMWYVTAENHTDVDASDLLLGQTNPAGILSDIAPTVLDIYGLQKPPEMTGRSLLPNLK